jgi:hypothetical protein
VTTTTQTTGTCGNPRSVQAQLDRVAEYQRVDERGGEQLAPDGCYFCGGNHTTDACDSADRDEFYEALR